MKIKVIYKRDSAYLLIKSKNPVFFIDVYYPNLTFSDRGFYLLPGEEIELKIGDGKSKLFKASDFKIYSLNDYLHS